MAWAGERQLADLVEEERAALRRLEGALPGRDGAGERAPLVAEELALDQALGQRRAVDGDERRRRVRAEPVQVARDQLLAGAALAEISTGLGIGATRAIASRSSAIGGAAADQRGLPAELPAERADLGAKPTPLQRASRSRAPPAPSARPCR